MSIKVSSRHPTDAVACRQAAAHVVPFLARSAYIAVPGPFLAKFSDFWLIRQAMMGKRFETVHELHKKHGELSCKDSRT